MGYIWVIIAAHLGLVYFFYDDGSRSEDVILEELNGYEGTIQSDGLKAYKKVAAQSDGKILRLACLQHCKRDFVDMKGNPDADEILSLANELYEREHEHRIGRDGWTVEDNLRWRQEYAPPILAKLKAALLCVQAKTDKYPPKSQMHGAVNYFLNEWDGIEAIATGGDYNWDNNLIERINRYISLSRKNSLFFVSQAGQSEVLSSTPWPAPAARITSTSSSTSPMCSIESQESQMEPRQMPSGISSRIAGQRKSRANDPAFFKRRLRQCGDAYNFCDFGPIFF